MNFKLKEKVVFVRTGNFNLLDSKEISRKMEISGTEEVKEISTVVDYLVIGNEPNMELVNESEKQGIISLTEKEFISIIENGSNFKFKITSNMTAEKLSMRFFDKAGLFVKIKIQDEVADYNLRLNQILDCKEFNNLEISLDFNETVSSFYEKFNELTGLNIEFVDSYNVYLKNLNKHKKIAELTYETSSVDKDSILGEVMYLKLTYDEPFLCPFTNQSMSIPNQDAQVRVLFGWEIETVNQYNGDLYLVIDFTNRQAYTTSSKDFQIEDVDVDYNIYGLEFTSPYNEKYFKVLYHGYNLYRNSECNSVLEKITKEFEEYTTNPLVRNKKTVLKVLIPFKGRIFGGNWNIVDECCTISSDEMHTFSEIQDSISTSHSEGEITELERICIDNIEFDEIEFNIEDTIYVEGIIASNKEELKEKLKSKDLSNSEIATINFALKKKSLIKNLGITKDSFFIDGKFGKQIEIISFFPKPDWSNMSILQRCRLEPGGLEVLRRLGANV